MEGRFSIRRTLVADLRRYRSVMIPGAKLDRTMWLSLLAPRFAPVLLCRIAHWLHLRRLGPLAKAVSLLNFMVFGIEIAVRCPIGPGLILPHTQGTVIGANSVGSNVTIFQGVTIGAKELDIEFILDRRPVIGSDVIIGSGAKVLGGIEIGDGSRIGANTVVIKSIAPNSLAVGAAMRVVAADQSN